MISRKGMSRAAGAAWRSGMVVLLIGIPHFVLAGDASEGASAVAFLAIAAALFVAYEYLNPAPALIEFRDAPPYNRLRIAGLLIAVPFASVLLEDGQPHGTLCLLLHAVGAWAAGALEGWPSPVGALAATLPADADPLLAQRIMEAGAVVYLTSLLVVLCFLVLTCLRRWPGPQPFNVWVNMPQFHFGTGNDVVEKLRSCTQMNILLGLVLPYVLPLVLSLGLLPTFGQGAGGPQPMTLVWMVTIWAFLPAFLLMRGIALTRLVRMLAAQRARGHAVLAALQGA